MLSQSCCFPYCGWFGLCFIHRQAQLCRVSGSPNNFHVLEHCLERLTLMKLWKGTMTWVIFQIIPFGGTCLLPTVGGEIKASRNTFDVCEINFYQMPSVLCRYGGFGFKDQAPHHRCLSESVPPPRTGWSTHHLLLGSGSGGDVPIAEAAQLVLPCLPMQLAAPAGRQDVDSSCSADRWLAVRWGRTASTIGLDLDPSSKWQLWCSIWIRSSHIKSSIKLQILKQANHFPSWSHQILGPHTHLGGWSYWL